MNRGDSTENEDDIENDNEKDSDYNPLEIITDSENSIYEENNTNAKKKSKKRKNKGDAEDGTGPILFPEGHRFDKKFTCVRYPGKVLNADRAVETLGGLSSISTAVNTPNRRLELRFRPADGYCKPACGDRHQVTGFLLRIRIKKSRTQKLNESVDKQSAQNFRHLIPAMPKNINSASDNSNEPEYDRNNSLCDIKRANNDDQTTDNLADRVRNLTCNSNDSESVKNNQSGDQQAPRNVAPTFDRKKYEDLSQDENYQLPKLKILGRVDTEFRFATLCDFQFLPVARNPTTKQNECVYKLLHPIGILPLKWLDNKVPYFLPPAVFSRMDNVQQYSLKTESKETGPENVIGKTRKRRAGFSNFINFNNPTIPMVPPKGIEIARKIKFLNNLHFEKIHALFEERPIWSKTALLYKTSFSNDQLKILLPSVAYYFITGPWRIMWVKLGYDPRKDPKARIYQTLDYRLKSMHGLEQSVKGKRTYCNYVLPYKSAPMSKPKTAVLTNMRELQQMKKGKKFTDDLYIYREGTVPPSRQMFYQYCDVHSEEIQEMLAKLPDPLPGTKCDEKRGWLPVGFSDHCREIINKQVRLVLRKKLNIPEDHPTSLPRKRKVQPSTVMRSKDRGKRKRLTEKLMKSIKSENIMEAPKEVDEDNPESYENTAETDHEK